MALTAEFTVSQFRGWKSTVKGGRAFFSWALSLDLLVASASSQGPLSLCTHIPGISSSSYKHPSHLESELPLASFYLHYFFKGPFILQSYSQVLGVRTSIYEFGGLRGWHSSVPTSSLGKFVRSNETQQGEKGSEWRLLRQHQWQEQANGQKGRWTDGCYAQ